jgi:hypothetical protein
VLVAGEVDDVVDLAGGVQVPDERPGRVDLAVSARGGAAVDVDDVLVARLLIAVLVRGRLVQAEQLPRPAADQLQIFVRPSWVSSR